MAPIFFYAMLIYVLYRFVAGFVIPVYRTSKQFRQQVRNMQGHSPDEMNPRNQKGWSSENRPRAHSNHPPGDYIDFEEIKMK
jgi:hypothetical protein